MPPIRAIFFDVGDTLVFDEPPIQERFWIATQRVGIDYLKDGLEAAFRIGEGFAVTRYLQGQSSDTPHVLKGIAFRVLDALGVPALNETRWQALVEAFLSVPWRRTLHPQALPLFEELRRRGFRLGVISDWEDSLPDLLAEMGLAAYLQALAVSAIVGRTKPDARLFGDALRQMGVASGAALHVGDWYELDVQGAQSVGMAAVLFDHQRRRPEADCPRVESFDELAAFLLSLPCPAP